MKKILLLIIFIVSLQIQAYANEQEALDFFNNFDTLSNQWSLKVIDLYSQNPSIKRNVLKNQPILVIVPYNEHKKYLEYCNKHKKILRGVRNNYKNVTVKTLSNNQYKISAQRCPTIMKKCFDCYMIIQKQNGKFQITEEYSDVQSTYFLKFNKKKK